MDSIYSSGERPTERYYLEDILCSYVVRQPATSVGEGSRGSDGLYRHRISSPSETSGSERYSRKVGNAVHQSSPLIYGSCGSAYTTTFSNYLLDGQKTIATSTVTSSSSSIANNTVDGYLLTNLDRFSPSLDQGYATLVPPSPSGGIGIGGISAGHQTPGPWNHHRSTLRSIGSIFDLLSDDAVLMIFTWLDSCELCTMARVSRRFEALVWRPVLWKHIKLRGKWN